MTPDQFRAARKAAGLTQSQAAKRLGVSRSTLAKWEGGKHRIPSAAAQILQAAAKLGRVANLENKE